MDNSMLFAFNPDRKLVRKTIYLTVEDAKFPFSAGDLEEEAMTQLTTYFSWDYTEKFHEKWRILSYKDFSTEGERREGKCGSKTWRYENILLKVCK